MKYFNFKRYKFNSVIKKLTILEGIFLKSLNYLNLKKYNTKPLLKYLNFIRLKYLDFSRYNFKKLSKKLNTRSYKLLSLYFLISFIFIGIVYLIIPSFFNYDKIKIE